MDITAQNNMLSRAKRLCSLRECCIQEMQQRLQLWGATPNILRKILHALQEEGFLNEARYARAFCRDKLRFNQWGPVKIRYILRSKGLREETIQEAIQEIEPSLWSGVLMELLKKKAETLKTLPDYEKKARLVRYAGGKGFEPDQIEKALSSPD